MTLTLDDYRALVALDAPFERPEPLPKTEVPHLVSEILVHLVARLRGVPLARHRDTLMGLPPRDRLQAILTLLPPRPNLGDDVQVLLDRLFATERAGVVPLDAMGLPTIAEAYGAKAHVSGDRCSLWQGDITTLAGDAIVNAANDELLGCFQPFHACIDNAIHAVAGPRLREDCDRIMARQGAPEKTGHAKITRGYMLPARFVLHTVGPIYRDASPTPSTAYREALADCYRACLDLAAQVKSIRSLAFCCISTGVFGFPQEPAAAIALQTVGEWLEAHPERFDRVVFNVFSARDLRLYEGLLAA